MTSVMVLSANRIILFAYGYLTIHKKSTRYCDQCDDTFKYKITINNHKHSKHEVVRYDCDQSAWHGLSQWIKTCTSNCDQCDDTFKDKNTMNNHKHSKHEVVKYDCDQCDDCFTLNCILINHKKANMNKNC